MGNTVIVTVLGGVAEVYEPSLPPGYTYVVIDLDAAEDENLCAACMSEEPVHGPLCPECHTRYGHALKGYL